MEKKIEQRNALLAQMDELVKDHSEDAEFETKFAELEAQYKALDAEIKKEESKSAKSSFLKGEQNRLAEVKPNLQVGRENKTFKADNSVEFDGIDIPSGSVGVNKAFSSREAQYKVGKAICDMVRGRSHQTTMTGNGAGTGGEFVADEFANAVSILRKDYGVMRQLATVWPMKTDVLYVPAATNAITGAWVSQGSGSTPGNDTTAKITLTAGTYLASVTVSNQLLDDAFLGVAAYLAESIAEDTERELDSQAFVGTGSPYTGLITTLGTSHAASVANADAQSVAELDHDDWIKPIAQQPNIRGARNAWCMHKSVYAESLLALELAAGGNTRADIQSAGRPSFNGDPIYFVDSMVNSTEAESGDIVAVYGDFRKACALGIREDLEITSSGHAAFLNYSTIVLGASRFAFAVDRVGTDSVPGAVIALQLGSGS